MNDTKGIYKSDFIKQSTVGMYILDAPKGLVPLHIFRNRVYRQGVEDGFLILLSKDSEYWKVAFSYVGMGCSILTLTDEEILKNSYLGYLPELLKIPTKLD